MITSSHILNTTPRSRLYGHMRDYHRARPGHSSRPHVLVSGINDEELESTSVGALPEWDIRFHQDTTPNGTNKAIGDLLALRTTHRSGSLQPSILDSDSHPVILLATDVALTDAAQVGRQVLLAAERGGTLSDVPFESAP
ncbi:hypothetical protein [Gordonia polyisoprenivorans]|uniref:hypothetical protein n=1 Tax=Gordonia polyisoprenivorans TaxID=84595 RepID=UPI0005BC897D|nr:hypothetical protein [Gordonia polyisoprenivorans]